MTLGEKKKAKKAVRKLAKADRKATHSLASYRERMPVKFAGMIGEVADQPQLIVASLGTIGIGLVTKRRDLVRGGSRMLVAHLVATAAKSLLKSQVDRSRPHKSIEDGHARIEKAEGAEDTAFNSFPSGHTAGAVAVARAASRDIEGAAGPAALGAGAIAALQPPTASHYISDVIAGAVVGWASEAIVSLLFDRVEPAIEHAIEKRIGDSAAVA